MGAAVEALALEGAKGLPGHDARAHADVDLLLQFGAAGALFRGEEVEDFNFSGSHVTSSASSVSWHRGFL
ncbi:hypothetical protein Dcar01_02807 [Deinococcus carri]|uniref:Uncharacterized protein n=1 Tax=Deinococcus carri TaxID=1211323 RepID=A0ABP9WD89_9DEIO